MLFEAHQIYAMLGVNSQAAMFSEIVNLARCLGFDYCSYFLQYGVTGYKTIQYSTPPGGESSDFPSTVDLGPRELHGDIIPVAKRCIFEGEPLIWHACDSSGPNDIWKDLCDRGMQQGWAFGAYDPKGLWGLVTFGRRSNDLDVDQAFEMKLHLLWLARFTHARMCRLVSPTCMADSHPALSDRELEVLRLTGEGKTSGRIAEQLGITTRGVNFHVQNVMTKLNAHNKTEAVCLATRLTLI
jgi:LuxR family quorum-sensing system transcriptional regulator SolR